MDMLPLLYVQKGLALGLIPYCDHLEILNNFLQFVLDLRNYVVGLGQTIIDVKDISDIAGIATTHACWDKTSLIMVGLDLSGPYRARQRVQIQRM